MGATYDAIVVGSGPNGLAAGIVLARAGLSVLMLERNAEPGGGARTEELTLPGFHHDVCSSVHPLAFASPLFRRLGLERYGLAPIESPAPLAHVLSPDHVVMLERSLEATAAGLGPDAAAYRDLFEPFVEHFEPLQRMLLGPLRWPASPLLLSRFGLLGLRSLESVARSRFRTEEARALLAGMAAHSMLPLDATATTSFALVLGIAAHAVGWPLTRGGSRSITTALVSTFRTLGGVLETSREVTRLEELPPARAVLLDVTPRQLLALAGPALRPAYRRRLSRFQYGPGVFKVDWALREPVPWLRPECARAATVHLCGDLRSLARSESAVHLGKIAAQPFVLFVQPSLFDPSRAPAGLHTAWAYCHAPFGSSEDLASRIEAEVERCAPGFRDVVLARSTKTSIQMEAYNPNYVGGDINGGSARLSQLLSRPLLQVDPYVTSLGNVFLCSSSTPPGGGVHGMCGYFAAKTALRNVFQLPVPAELDIEKPQAAPPALYQSPGSAT
jgi:phytoene dehydrogenase-like protein